jgi:hypothetical protein
MKKSQDELERQFWKAHNNNMIKPLKQPAVGGHQTKLESALEQMCNVGSGMIIAYAIMELFLAPMLHIGITPIQNMWTTIILTTVSVVRGYIWRRVFNRKLYKIWANWILNQ